MNGQDPPDRNNKSTQVPEPAEQVERAKEAQRLIEQAVALGEQGRLLDEVDIYRHVLSAFGDDADAGCREFAAMAGVNAGIAWSEAEHLDEALDVLAEVCRRFGDEPSPAIGDQVIRALMNTSYVLDRLARHQEEISAYDEIIRRFGDSEDAGHLRAAAIAYVNKSLTLHQVGKPDEALHTCEEVLGRYESMRLPELREPLASARLGVEKLRPLARTALAKTRAEPAEPGVSERRARPHNAAHAPQFSDGEWDTLRISPFAVLGLVTSSSGGPDVAADHAFESWLGEMLGQPSNLDEWLGPLASDMARWRASTERANSEPLDVLNSADQLLGTMADTDAYPYRQALVGLAERVAATAGGSHSPASKRMARLIQMRLLPTPEQVSTFFDALAAKALNKDDFVPQLEIQAIEAMYRHGRLEDVIDASVRLRGRLRELPSGSVDFEIAQTYEIEGRARAVNDPPAGERLLREAIDRMRPLNEAASARCAITLADHLRLTGRTREADDIARGALRTLTDANEDDPQAIGRAEFVSGLIARSLGRPEEAERHVRSARSRFEQAGDAQGTANAENELAVLALDADRDDDAATLFEDALRRYEALDDPLGKAHVNHYLGEIAMRRDALDEARTRYATAIELYKGIPEPVGIATTEFELGRLDALTGDGRAAVASLTSALRQYQTLGDSGGSANCYCLLGQVYRASGNAEQARQMFHIACNLYAKDGSPSLAKSLLGEASATVQADKAEAMRLAWSAVERLDRIRGTLRSTVARYEHGARWQTHYLEAIKIACECIDHEAALTFALRLHGRLITEEILAVDRGPDASETEARFAYELRRLHELHAQGWRGKEGSQPALETEATRLTDLWASTDRLLTARDVDAGVISAVAHKDGVAIITFVWRSDVHLAFVTTPQETFLVEYQTDAVSLIEATIAAIEAQVASRQAIAAQRDEVWDREVATLRTLLWAPLAAKAGALPVRVLSDGLLSYVPYSLVVPRPFRLLPGPGLLARSHDAQREYSDRLIAIGSPAMDLPGVSFELALVEALGGKPVGADGGLAPWQALLSGSASATICYVASHMRRPFGLEDGVIQLRSSPGDHEGQMRAISPAELLRLRLECEVLVLSGCWSAIAGTGPELLSAGAVLQAVTGARVVIATQFPVSDLAAVLFSAELLPALMAGVPVEEAVADALASMRGARAQSVRNRLDGVASAMPGTDDAVGLVKVAYLSEPSSAANGEPLVLPPSDRAAFVILGR
jgi:tetratricopeptide (TPR) repeat protein